MIIFWLVQLAVTQRCSYEKAFWKYAANLQEQNMQQIYKFKVAKQRYWNHTSVWVFSCKFAAYFQNTFS